MPAHHQIMSHVERAFHCQVLADVEIAKSLGYNPRRFPEMVFNDPKLSVGVAHRLLAASHWQEGFERMWELGKIDLTVEARSLEPQRDSIFSETERAEARRRLRAISEPSANRS